MWNLPNILTLLRIALIPVFIVVYYTSWEWHNLIAAAHLWSGGSTDWVDGYVARKYNLITPLVLSRPGGRQADCGSAQW